MILKILKKIKHEYEGKWSSYLTDILWACRSSLKTTTGFSPFSLIYANDIHTNERLVDLEGLEEKREVTRRKIQR